MGHYVASSEFTADVSGQPIGATFKGHYVASSEFTAVVSGQPIGATVKGHYVASSNLLPTFRDNISVPPSKVKKMGPMLSRNVGNKLLLTAWWPRRA